MENATQTHDRRLRAQAERMLQALEALPVPDTYAEVLRAARALIAVKKALDLIHAEAEGETAETSEDAEPPVLNRQMRRMAEALARKQAKAGDYRRHGSG